MSDVSGRQGSLTEFGGNSDSGISLPEEGVDLDQQREVRRNAEDAANSGWDVLAVTNERISWWDPDGAATYYLDRDGSEWSGNHDGEFVDPHGLEDLQEAIEAAGGWMSDHPIGQGGEDDG